MPQPAVVDLSDPTVEPNPQLKALSDAKNALYTLAMDTMDAELRGHYMAAYNRCVAAIEHVCAAKNRIAVLTGQEEGPA